MKDLKNWMGAAILTVCSAMTLTACVEEDNPSNQPSEQSKYTTEQIKRAVVGLWLDKTKLTPGDTERLYEITDDGQCNLYDLSVGESNDEKVEIDGVTTYSGTWSVTNETAKLDFIDQLNFDGFELMGGLILKTKMQIDESDDAMKQLAASGLLLNQEETDTLAVLRSEGGDMLFLNRYEADFYAMLIETGQLSSEEAATRAATRAMTEDEIKQKIDYIEGINGFVNLLNEGIYNPSYMFFHYSVINPRVCDMSILGAAAVPSYYVPEVKAPAVLPVGLKRQYLSVTQLWRIGVRYFDLGCLFKPGTDEDTYAFYDPDADYLYPNVKPMDVFKELKGMLDECHDEVAIIKLSMAPNTTEEHFQKNVSKLRKDLEDAFGARLLTDYGPDIRMNDCKGRMIVMNDFPYSASDLGLQLGSIWKENSDSESLVFPNGKKGTVRVHVSQKLNDKADADRKIEHVKGTLDFASKSAKDITPTWVITNLSSYVLSYGGRCYSMMARTMNETVSKELLSKKYAKTGIVVVEFVGKNGCVNEPLGLDPKGTDIVGSIIGTDYYAVINHRISFDNGDMPK